jgi:Zn-dependent membrane protease YugP
MGDLGLYIIFLVPPLVIGLIVQARLQRTVKQQMQVPVASGMTGREVAQRILQHNGLGQVPVDASRGGALSDHYDPRHRSIHLSEPVYRESTVASVAIAAHEVGHALQHEAGYSMFRLRSAMWPAVAFASRAWLFILLIGAFAGALGLVQFAIVLFAVVVVFQLVTLPVEFDASRRATVQLANLGLVTESERAGAKQVLNAAAWTYVAAALAALTQLAYYALIFLGNRN